MAAEDDVNRELREFKRYTGDGLPGEPSNAPLPVGDPSSGVHNPKKSGLRAMLLSVLNRAQQILDDAVAIIVPDDGVSTIKIQDGAVTTPKLADGSVTTPKLAAGAATLAKIGDDAKADFRLVDPNGPRSIIGYYGPYSIQIVGETSFAMGGFRSRGQYKRDRVPVFPAPAFTSEARHIISAGDGTTTQDDLGVETLHAKSCWYAAFACADDGDSEAVFKLMPYFKVGSVAGSVVTLNISGEASRTVSAKSHTMPTNGLVGAECLVITETLNSRENAFSHRLTTVTANTGTTITLDDVGSMDEFDYFLVAPPGFDHYRYLGSFYIDSSEVRNIADTGTIVHSRGSTNSNASINGLIGASGVDMFCDGYISPLAAGMLIQWSEALSTSETGRAYSTWGMDYLHDSVSVSWAKTSTAADAVDLHGGIVPFIFQPMVNFRSAGALNTANNNRSMKMYGWIEP